MLFPLTCRGAGRDPIFRDGALERFELAPSSEALPHLIRVLGYLDDVEQDDSLPLNKRALARWWQERQPRLVRALSRRG
jgi:hypothetical protein